MRFLWEQGEIENELKKLEGPARHLIVASAYFGDQGVYIIRDLAHRLQLSSGQVTVFLSDAFTEKQPATVLRNLCEVSHVWIVRDPFLHAKVVLVLGERPMVFFGSANLTESGLERNLEFSALTPLENGSLEKVVAFFKYLQGLAIPVTPRVIAAYERYEQHTTPQRKLSPARETLVSELEALRLHSTDPVSLGKRGQLLTFPEVGALTGVRMPRGRLRYARPVSNPPAAYIVTRLGAEGDEVDPPDHLVGDDTLYLTDQRLERYARQVLDAHRERPDSFPLWIVEQVSSNVYRSLGLATIRGYVEWQGAPRWLISLSPPCEVFPASAKEVCVKALSSVDPGLQAYLAKDPIEKDRRYSVERAVGMPHQHRPRGRSVTRWLAAGPIEEAEWVHLTVEKDQGQTLLRYLYPSGMLPRSATQMVRSELNQDSDVILLTRKDLRGVTAYRWNSFLHAALKSFLRHNGMVD